MVLTQQQTADIEFVVSKTLDIFKKEILDHLTKHFDDKVKEIVTRYEEQIGVLTNKLKEAESKIVQFEVRTDDLEQYSRRNSVRIFGLQETADEDVQKSVVAMVEGNLRIKLVPEDIDRCHRTGPRIENRTRPVILKFTRYNKKAEVLSQRRQLKGKRMSIQDDLTKQRLQLLKLAREKYGDRNAWTSNGRVLIKTARGIQQIQGTLDI